MMCVAFLKDKYEAFEKFKIVKNRFENESSVKIKCLRSDRGGEFTYRQFNMSCGENAIKRQLPSVVEVARVMLFENDVSKTFWREAWNIVVYTLNRVQIRKGMSKTPYELWFGHYH